MALTAALAFTGTAAGAVWTQLNSNTHAIDIADLVSAPPAAPTPKDPDDPYAGQVLNILVMGTDYRDEENAAIAGKSKNDAGMRSDTTFLVHISGDRSYIEVISFPRDALVPIPACEQPDGGTSKPTSRAMFNSAFDTGANGEKDPEIALKYAAACTYNTVQQLTGISLTNFVVLKMAGVIDVVDALGGVTMCFDEPVVGNKRYSPDLNLPAGQYTLSGREAIAFVRARKGKGMGLEDGSDTERIKRQQAFIDSMMSQLLTGNIMSDTPRLYQVLQAVLGSLVTDPQLSNLQSDIGIALALGKNLDSTRIVFTELPWAQAPSDANRVVFTSEAKDIWARIAANEPPPSIAPPADPGVGDADAGTADPGAAGTETPAVPVVPEPVAPAPGVSDPSVAATPAHLPGVCYDGWVPPAP